MKTVKNTLSVTFYLNKGKVNKDEKSPIVARITLNTKRLQISTGKVIEESRWNGVKGIAKGSKEEVARLNSFLSNFHGKISEAYKRLNANNKLMSLNDLKEAVEGRFHGNMTIAKLVGYHNESQGEFLEWGYYEKLHDHSKVSIRFYQNEIRI